MQVYKTKDASITVLASIQNLTAMKPNSKKGKLMNYLSYISGEPGSGKGIHIKKTIFNNPNGKYLIVQPTTDLIDEFSKDIPDALVLHSHSFKGDLLTEIQKHLANDGPAVIFITDKMFYRIDPYRLKTWKIFIDDCVDFCNVIVRNKSGIDNMEMVYQELFITDECVMIDDNYLSYELCPKENVSEDLHQAYEYYEQLNMYHRKAIYKESFSTKYNKVVVWGDYDIKRYTEYDLDITYLANNFESTLLYKANKDLFKKVDYENLFPMGNNKRLVINYFIEGTKNKLSKSIMKNDTNTINSIQKYITENVDNYYWTKNNDEEITFELPGQYLTPNQRGKNSLKHYTSCVFMAAMNPSDVVLPHYNNVWGITAYDLVQNWTYEILYQYIYRGIIRDYDSEEVMKVYVYDEGTAKSVYGATYNYIDLGLNHSRKDAGRPKGTEKYSDEDKKLDGSWRAWYCKNKDKSNLNELFGKWRNKKESEAVKEGKYWTKQLDRYNAIITQKVTAPL
jgi:hypothetical protein